MQKSDALISPWEGSNGAEHDESELPGSSRQQEGTSDAESGPAMVRPLGAGPETSVPPSDGAATTMTAAEQQGGERSASITSSSIKHLVDSSEADGAGPSVVVRTTSIKQLDVTLGERALAQSTSLGRSLLNSRDPSADGGRRPSIPRLNSTSMERSKSPQQGPLSRQASRPASRPSSRPGSAAAPPLKHEEVHVADPPTADEALALNTADGAVAEASATDATSADDATTAPPAATPAPAADAAAPSASALASAAVASSGAADVPRPRSAPRAEDSDDTFSVTSTSDRHTDVGLPALPGARTSNTGQRLSGSEADGPPGARAAGGEQRRTSGKGLPVASVGGAGGPPGSRQGARPEPPSPPLPPMPRMKGALPFMERTPSGAAAIAAQLPKATSGHSSPPAGALRPLKGLASGASPSQQQQQQGQQQQPHAPPQPDPHQGSHPASPSVAASAQRMDKSGTSMVERSHDEFVRGYASHDFAEGLPLAAPPRAAPRPENQGIMEGVFMVRGLRDKQPGRYLEQPRRPKKPGRLNFRNLFGPQAHTGGGTLPPSMIKEGLLRRAAAASMMVKGPQPFMRKPEPRPITPEGARLDGFMMLEAGDEDLPENVMAVKLSHRHISSVEAADMSYFPSLKVLDLSDNRVPGMEDLVGLVGLRQLSLASNNLQHLGSLGGLEAPAFQELQTLDLTYNTLRPRDVLGVSSPLAMLPNLRELDLSGNSLSSLPDDLGAFPSLALLRLNRNRLSGGVLVPLGRLPSLRELSMSGNVVTAAYEDVADPGNFPQLRVLDLTHNKICEEEAVAPLRLLPCLRMLLLAGNPLALHQQQAVKKAREKRELHGLPARSDGTPDSSGVQGLQIMYQAVSELPLKVTIANILAAHSHQIPRTLDPRAATKAAGEAAVAAASDEALMEAFDRVDSAIDAWQLNTVNEEDEEESGDEAGPAEEDTTFLTGVGIEEKQKRRPKQKEEPPPEPSHAEPERPLWEDVTDPTERLALALGLDPRQLAIYTGRLTTDSVGSINALRFALAHPLVEADEGLRPAQHHLGMTTAAKLKRRDRKLVPIAHGAPAAAAPLPDVKTVRIQTMESMLQGMKDRLKGLENSLADKLAAAHKAGSIMDQGRKAKAGAAMGTEDDDDDLLAPGPLSPTLNGPELAGGGNVDGDDARSDVSALPEDVIDAIENPALSDSDEEDNFLPDDEADQDGQNLMDTPREGEQGEAGPH